MSWPRSFPSLNGHHSDQLPASLLQRHTITVRPSSEWSFGQQYAYNYYLPTCTSCDNTVIAVSSSFRNMEWNFTLQFHPDRPAAGTVVGTDCVKVPMHALTHSLEFHSIHPSTKFSVLLLLCPCNHFLINCSVCIACFSNRRPYIQPLMTHNANEYNRIPPPCSRARPGHDEL